LAICAAKRKALVSFFGSFGKLVVLQREVASDDLFDKFAGSGLVLGANEHAGTIECASGVNAGHSRATDDAVDAVAFQYRAHHLGVEGRYPIDLDESFFAHEA
jgi:hypothetical protein